MRLVISEEWSLVKTEFCKMNKFFIHKVILSNKI